MITSDQIRAARALIAWSAKDLASHSGLSLRTIQTLETTESYDPARKSSFLAVKAALEAAGVEFIGTPDDGPGIRLRRPKI